MLKAIAIATILIASNAMAGQIVWRSPVAGVLPHISDSSPTQPELEPVLGIHYGAIRVARGSVVNVRPVGNTTGYVFASKGPLPVGLTLDPATGRIVGVAVVAGNYDLAIRAEKDGLSGDLVLSITIS
ncbi:Ig domain-containing protein [Rhizobium sp. 3T7]|uniref:Ig domain-containing protein n=1 Tax=Rhizobium sp. 3T7 TaxID=2874922 RepID=UPI001CCA2EE7|nr:Ig domain-containing protein [Rhizobium sp. 3T7]MBZ9788527.1 Ig domain-containing protein [Rhizobium sp. 3T7]